MVELNDKTDIDMKNIMDESAFELDAASVLERERLLQDKSDRNPRERSDAEDKISEITQNAETKVEYGLDCGFKVQSHDEKEAKSIIKHHAKTIHKVSMADSDIKSSYDFLPAESG